MSCLCNYYNQRVHDKLDRNPVLPVLRELSGARVDASVPVAIGADYDALLLKCESSLEDKVLQMIRDNGIRLPGEAQYLVHNNGDIIAKPDFAYVKDGFAIAVFVDEPDMIRIQSNIAMLRKDRHWTWWDGRSLLLGMMLTSGREYWSLGRLWGKSRIVELSVFF